MVLSLSPALENSFTTGRGHCFGAAAQDLINNLINDFGKECLDDGYVFEGLAKLAKGKCKNNIFKHFEIDRPEDEFELALFQ